MDDTEYMQAAVEAAKEGHSPYGAVFVKDNEILATASNRSGSDSLAHAEVELIRAVEDQFGKGALRKGTVYTTGEPCPMCAGALVWSGARKVVFGASIRELHQAGQSQILVDSSLIFRQGHHEIQWKGGVLREEVLKLFR